MPTLEKAKWVLTHDDGFCANGKRNTPLNKQGHCPVCEFHPDTQSTAFILACPKDNTPLKNGHCYTCGSNFDITGL
jgi:hypothetical protein